MSSDDHFDRHVKPYLDGFTVGMVTVFLGTAGLAFLMALAFHRTQSDGQRDWLRTRLVKTGQYTPCENAGADWAMGVDCESFTKLRGAK